MTDDSTKENCLRCGGTTSKITSGSITQWMVRCTCGSFTQDAEEELIDICGNCNKRIGRGREGSFTQWIFRSDICSCSTPDPHKVSSDFIVQQELLDQDESPQVESDQAELEVDSDKFPVERYKPIAIIGEGSAGSVYLCHDRMLAKKVAIKILKNLTSEQLVAFQTEAKAASKLRHRNVVSIHDFGATPSGSPYMVMEFFSGSTLTDVLKSQAVLDEPTALSVFAQVCDGLSESHKNGIFHRDIKSANILVSKLNARIPDVRIIDFGVAGFSKTPDKAQREQYETFVGTPQYMSPDQAVGLLYDARSEVYSVGCTLFEAVTGELPFAGTTALEVIHHHANTFPRKLSEARPDLSFSQDVETIVAKCLEKRQSDRFSSAAELGQSLRNALAKTHPSFSEPESELKSSNAAFEVESKHRWIAGLSVVIVVIAGILCFRLLSAENPAAQSSFKTNRSSDTISGDTGKSVGNSNDEKASGTGKFSRDFFQSVPDDAAFRWTDDKLNGPTVTASRYIAVSDVNLAHLKPVKRIFKLELGGSLVTGTGLKYLKDTSIDYLDLWNSPVDDAGLRQVAKIKDLHVLIISRCDSLTDESIKYIADMPDLQILVIGGRSLTERSLQFLSANKSMAILVLSAMNVTERGIEDIQKIKNLKTLEVRVGNISEQGYNRLRKAPHALEQFQLDGRKFDDREFASVSRVNSKKIVLSECQISARSLDTVLNNPKFRWERLTCQGREVENRFTRRGDDVLNSFYPY